jgi:hypothetical protein
LTFYPSKKVAPSLIRVEKKFLQNWPCRVSKEAEFCADFKNVEKSQVWQKEKKFLQKNLVFRDLENFAKNRVSEKKSLGTSSRPNQNHMKQSDLGKSLDHTMYPLARRAFPLSAMIKYPDVVAAVLTPPPLPPTPPPPSV